MQTLVTFKTLPDIDSLNKKLSLVKDRAIKATSSQERVRWLLLQAATEALINAQSKSCGTIEQLNY